MSLTSLLLSLIIIYVAARAGGELAQRMNQPAVLGELLGGLVVGLSGFNLIDPKADVLHLMAELGVLILLFEVGLETKLHDLTRVGAQALAVAAIGILAPISLANGLALLWGLPVMPALLIGVALSSTSIAVSARVLSDQGMLASAIGSIILGAAIIDDVVGVGLLGIMSSVVDRGVVDPAQVTQIVVVSVGFLAVTLLLGHHLEKPLLRLVKVMRGRGILVVTFLTFALALAYLASILGSATLLGAFAAGLLLEETEERRDLETQIKPVADIFTPIFFVSVGASIDLRQLNPFDPTARSLLLFAVLLIAVATITKLIAGWGAWRSKGDRLVVGVGMLARGEIGLIFAGVGATAGLLSPGLYAVLVAAIAATTMMAPPWLRWLLGRRGSTVDSG